MAPTDKPDPQKLFSTAKQINKLVKEGRSRKYIEDQFKDFKENTPHLFNLVVENKDGVMEGLERMVDAATLVHTGQVPLEEMDKKVGLELAKEFVYPNIDMAKEAEASKASSSQ